MLRGGKMLKVGDKVRIREDLIVNSNYGGEMFCGGYMETLKGRIATIVEVYDCLSYDIDIDEEGWMWTEEMFEIIEKEVSVNMKIKEMTLNEILDSILEGELEIEEFDKQFGAFCYEKGMELLTKQFKRPQYTFQEAFKAFEEGKEIESCVTSYTFQKIDDYIEVS